MKKQYLDSGKIVGTHGIKGEVRIEPWCDSPEFLCAFKKLYLDENGQTFIEVKSRPHKNITLAKIKGVDTIEEAEKLGFKKIIIPAGQKVSFRPKQIEILPVKKVAEAFRHILKN